LDKKLNRDQLLAANKALNYPLTYVQGPPGTGKTTMIVATVISAFLAERSVLLAAFNNHPVDGVIQGLRSLSLDGSPVLVPAIRLGDRRRVAEALKHMRDLYEKALTVRIDDKCRDKNIEDCIQQAEHIAQNLERYEEELNLLERRECLKQVLACNANLNLHAELESRQLVEIEARLRELGEGSGDEPLQLTERDVTRLLEHLNQLGARRVRRLDEQCNTELRNLILNTASEQDAVTAFRRYLSESENLRCFLEVFPIVATTCISSQGLGKPEPVFAMTIIDEASQCDSATALIPIVRGQNLMLVGDPQQLRPVSVLEGTDNLELRQHYQVASEYDYIDNSVYKVFLACDAVSDEILLREHYRCDERIIAFNNRKYYNNQLSVKSGRSAHDSITYFNIGDDHSASKNVAPAEAEAALTYVREHPQEDIGIITPFVNQREYIHDVLVECGLTNATCGTVHAFQGDEKDTILFSLALTDRTSDTTYAWLADNRELINVATSRAKNHLVLFSSSAQLERLHDRFSGEDDLYELYRYICTDGSIEISSKGAVSRALGLKPYSTKTENAFLENLSHALDNIFMAGSRHKVYREVPIAQVFDEHEGLDGLFFSGRFDFVVYEVRRLGNRQTQEIPVLAVELDGKEHRVEAAVMRRDERKAAICQSHGFQLIRIDNTYARRYNHIRDILVRYFAEG
jgi:hypothetical protein